MSSVADRVKSNEVGGNTTGPIEYGQSVSTYLAILEAWSFSQRTFKFGSSNKNNQENQEQLTKDKAELQRLEGKGKGKGGKWAGKLKSGHGGVGAMLHLKPEITDQVRRRLTSIVLISELFSRAD